MKNFNSEIVVERPSFGAGKRHGWKKPSSGEVFVLKRREWMSEIRATSNERSRLAFFMREAGGGGRWGVDSPSLNWTPMFSEIRVACDILGPNKLSGWVGEYRQMSWTVSLWLGFVWVSLELEVGIDVLEGLATEVKG